MSHNHWESQPRKPNGEFTYRHSGYFFKNIIEKLLNPKSVITGGKYGYLRKITAGNKKLEIHHMPADCVTNISRWNGPCIVMYKSDHSKTESFGNSKSARKYRALQATMVSSGHFFEAQMMDINEIREKFGTKYDNAINAKIDYEEKLEKEGKING